MKIFKAATPIKSNSAKLMGALAGLQAYSSVETNNLFTMLQEAIATMAKMPDGSDAVIEMRIIVFENDKEKNSFVGDKQE